MLQLSKIHNWQDNEGVKQILVFPSSGAQLLFEQAYAERVVKDGSSSASDTNIGAMYKIRAVLNGDDTWSGLIRCGVSAAMLHQTDRAPTASLALLEAYNLLNRSLNMPVPVDLIEMLETRHDEKVS